MTEHFSYLSEKSLKKELFRNIQNRYIDQKFLYLDKTAVDTHYHKKIEEENTQRMKKGLYNFYEVFKKILSKNKRIAIISLGCGNARAEKRSLQKLSKEGYNITYIGVDISKIMLEEAEQNLAEFTFNKIFLHMDITDGTFKEIITNITKDCEKRVYTLFGGTLSNINQTFIADILYNTLKKKDILWFDIRIRHDTTMETNMKLFNRYTKYLSDGTEKFCFHPLKKIGVPFNAGKMNVKMTYEPSVGALLFKFYFTFKEKIVLNIKDNCIHFLPNEKIKLLTIRTYDPKTLITFFKEHEFKFLHQMTKVNRGQFVFKK